MLEVHVAALEGGIVNFTSKMYNNQYSCMQISEKQRSNKVMYYNVFYLVPPTCMLYMADKQLWLWLLQAIGCCLL